MLTSVRIENLALVDRLEWGLPGGFIAVTGETGSGKSIIIGALKLLLGDRADKSLIRTGAENCTVEASFEIGDMVLNAELEKHGIDPCEGSQLILKRVLSRSGGSRQFVNCCATTLAILAQIGDSLVDLHGPHEHQSLLSADHQLSLLDAFAGSDKLRAEFSATFRELARLTAAQKELAQSEVSLEREIDLLRHQVNEINAASLQPGEGEEILRRYSLAANGRRLAELAGQIIDRLAESDEAALNRLREIQRLFRDLEKIDGATSEFATSHAEAVTALEEIAAALQRYVAHIDLDPAQLAQLEERVTLLETLKRKYGPSLEDVTNFGTRASKRLQKIEGRGEELARLEIKITAVRKQLLEEGTRLSKKRHAAAPKLASDIQIHLSDLGFNQSDFQIALAAREIPSADGLDTVSFLFAPNPGEPRKPLSAIASSGEISRVMLAVKTTLAAQDKIPLLVFDEIDANIGGEIAHAVGAKMRSLGASHQVICITHLAQVAAVAGAQFAVTKEFRGDRTISQLTPLEGKSRLEEIARMLGGKTDSALAHAKTLLTGV
jgi:DNA repair protein RecN (Recombination protein N)